MNAQATATSNARSHGALDLCWLALRRTMRTIRKWQAQRRAERDLYSLSDRALKDIGIDGSELHCSGRARFAGPQARPLLF